MTKKLNQSGFTLVEIMIAVAIISVLATIAIPNYISYRNKAFCSAAETDAQMVAMAIADYFAIPSRVNTPAADPTVNRLNGGLGARLSHSNQGHIGGNINAMTITITDGSGRCPDDYMNSVEGWDQADGTFSIVM